MSEAIYSSFGVYDCGWYVVRDIIIVVLWVVSFCFVCYMMDTIYISEALLFPVAICSFLVLAGLSCVWEIGIPVVAVGVAVYLGFAGTPDVSYGQVDYAQASANSSPPSPH
jgi:hypothetical protein